MRLASTRGVGREAAVARIEAGAVDVVLTDLRMPDMDGMTLLKEIARRWPAVPVILLPRRPWIGCGSAVRGDEGRARSTSMLQPFIAETSSRSSSPRRSPRPDGERGGRARRAGRGRVDSSARRRGCARSRPGSRRRPPGTATVLIRGGTGTGKELVARALHEAEPAARPVRSSELNCGGPAKTLLESELFGYEKGAFTGAATRKPGRVGSRTKGTLFLDEIGDVSPADAGEAACASCKSARSSASEVADHQGRRPLRRGDPPRPRGHGGRGAVPGRPLLPAERRAHPAPASPQSRAATIEQLGSARRSAGPTPDLPSPSTRAPYSGSRSAVAGERAPAPDLAGRRDPCWPTPTSRARTSTVRLGRAPLGSPASTARPTRPRSRSACGRRPFSRHAYPGEQDPGRPSPRGEPPDPLQQARRARPGMTC